MDRDSVVLETQAEFEGETLSATYFVDHLGVIHVSIDGTVVMVPAGQRPAEEGVQSLLRGHMMNRSKRGELLGKWSVPIQ